MVRTIYIIKNVFTHHEYVGMTCGDGNNRLKQHLSDAKGGRHKSELFNNDYKQYGESAFVVGVFKRANYSNARVIEMALAKTRGCKYNSFISERLAKLGINKIKKTLE